MLDTRHAITLSDNGSTAQFNLVDGVDTQVEIQSASLQLLQFQASHSIYNITDANNTLEFYITYEDKAASSLLLTLSNGHYSLDYLRTYINDKIQTIFEKAVNPFIFTKIDDNSTCQYTGLITFKTPSDTKTYGTLTGAYILADRYPGLPKTLGCYSPDDANYLFIDGRKGFGSAFNKIITDLGVNGKNYSYSFKSTVKNELYSVSESYITAGKFLDLSYPRSIYIAIDGLNTNNRCSLPGNSYGTILEKIPFANAAFGDNIYYEPYMDFPQLLPNFHINTIKIRTFDENGQPIDWNDGYWSITLGITWSIDVGSAGQEDTTAGRHFRPLLHATEHDPLRTQQEHKRRR